MIPKYTYTEDESVRLLQGAKGEFIKWVHGQGSNTARHLHCYSAGNTDMVPKQVWAAL